MSKYDDEPNEPEPIKNECGGYYCNEDIGHIDCQLNRDGTPRKVPVQQCDICKSILEGEPTVPEITHACTVHQCCSPGATMEGIKVEEITNAHGQHYWKATQEIGTLFGSEVEGGIEAIGATKEIALENLAKERMELYESLW